MNQDLSKVRSELEKVGLNNHVWVNIHLMENDRGKKVPHMVAEWNETTIDMFSSRTTGEMSYMVEEQKNAEEMNRYFCAELFAKGITQRAEWIKADHEDCVEYLKENQFGHPALYPVWKESQKVSV